MLYSDYNPKHIGIIHYIPIYHGNYIEVKNSNISLLLTLLEILYREIRVYGIFSEGFGVQMTATCWLKTML